MENYGFVPVLKQMPAMMVATIKTNSVPGKNPAHKMEKFNPSTVVGGSGC